MFEGQNIRTSMLRVCSAAAIIFFLTAALANSAQAQGTSDKSKIGAAITSKENFEAVFSDLDKCPADLSPDFIVPYIDQFKSCKSSQATCFDRCVSIGDANDCFALALLLQENEELDEKYAESLFARSCAGGLPGACTNRAAGMMNANSADPAAKLPTGENIRECVARSFEESCNSQDTWGCTMLGVVYRDGVGVAKDLKAATESFKKACAIDPESQACKQAKTVLEKTN